MSKAAKTESEEKIFNPDIVVIKILSLDLPDEDPLEYDIKAILLDQIVVSGAMTSNQKRTKHEALTGQIEYDPSDYRKMNKFADTPLAVFIQVAKLTEETEKVEQKSDEKFKDIEVQEVNNNFQGGSYCCNVDIVQIFTDEDYLLVEKRMESTTRSVLHAKSWQNLPLITIEVIAQRKEKNAQHHLILRDPNYFKFTVIGCCNMTISSDATFSYACITEMPMCIAESTYIALFNKGKQFPKCFNHTSSYLKWESLRAHEESYAKSDEKIFFDDLNEFCNLENLDLNHIDNVVLWTSFHRSLVVRSSEEWLYKYFHHKWPLEIHVCGGEESHCFVASLDLIKLIYPGEHCLRLAVPVQRVQAELSPEECLGEHLVSRTVSSTRIDSTKTNKETTGTNPTDVDTNYSTVASATDSDEPKPFILVEIKLARPLRKSSIPPSVSNGELMEMLRREERAAQPRRSVGRSHTDRHWRERVRAAAQMLYTLPMRDVCTFDHDLITSKTQVEIESSFWQEAAHYVNNNFMASQFLESDEAFEELRTLAHIHMMRAATETVHGALHIEERERLLQAARQARQMQDSPHAINLYLQLLAMHKRDADIWRELANCFKDVDKKMANVCIDKALKLNPRNPLSLLSKACLVMDEDIEEAEVFFIAILALYPFSTVLWIATSAYYFLRGLNSIFEQIIGYVKRMMSEDILETPLLPRAWGFELGDWWDHTPVLVGCTPYYDAADLLLRIRGITLQILHAVRLFQLAEVCVALSLSEAGATPMYYHLLALCCRLRGDVNTALCHLQHARARNGACYLYSLEGECHYKKGNWAAAKMCLEQSIYYSQPFSILLALSTSCLSRHDISVTRSVLMDLVRRQPSAYGWTRLAQFFLMNTNILRRMDAPSSSGDQDHRDLSTQYIVACAQQALKYDPYFEHAWTILSRTVAPSARRVYCQNMATWYKQKNDGLNFKMNSNLPRGDQIGKTMEECQCDQNDQ